MRPTRHITLSLALLALLPLAAAGCGGGGGSTESTASTTVETAPKLTKAALIEQGDGICAEVNAAVGSLTSSETPTAAAGTQVPSLYVGMVEDIEQLGTPDDTAGYPQFIEAAERLAKVEGEAKLAAEREDSVALSEAQTASASALEEFQAEAGVYGFEKCSEEASAPATAGGAAGSTGEEPEAAEEGGVEAEAEPEYVEPEYEEEAAPEEAAPETGGAGGSEGVAPEAGGETGGTSGGVGPG